MPEIVIALAMSLITLLLKIKKRKTGRIILFIPMAILICQIIRIVELETFYNFYKRSLLVIIILYQCFLSTVLYKTGFFKWSAHTIIFTAEKSELKLLFHILILSIIIAAASNIYLAAVLVTLMIVDISEATDLNYNKLVFFVAASSLAAGLTPYLSPTSSLNSMLHMLSTNLSYNELLSRTMLKGMGIILITLAVLYVVGKKVLSDFSNTSIVNPDVYIKDWKLLNICFLVIFLNHISYFIAFNNFKIQSLIISIWLFLILIYLFLNKFYRM